MTLRWGLLGTARINRRLIPAIRASARTRLAAVGTRDAARAAAYACEQHMPDAHGSYEALVAAPVDIVYNALPNSLHVPWTLAAIATDMEDAVLGIAAPRLTLDESRSHAATLAALHEAALTERPVCLS